jgi:hypothetical protein
MCTACVQVGYPERLGLAVFLGAPRVFGFMWRAVRVLLDARIVSKARCGASGVCFLLFVCFSSSIAARLCAEACLST